MLIDFLFEMDIFLNYNIYYDSFFKTIISNYKSLRLIILNVYVNEVGYMTDGNRYIFFLLHYIFYSKI